MTDAVPLAGWGRYPVVDCTVVRPGSPREVIAILSHEAETIARGNGRSYGDASLGSSITLQTTRLDRLISFDAASGIVECEAGLLLSDLIDVLLPRGWWPPVTPGTKLVTIGGMIAADVHGKNHHIAGSFCDHLLWLDLSIGDGDTVLRCSPATHADLFAATCGGMGLTGVILRAGFTMMRVESAAIRQRTIRAPSLQDAFDSFEATLGSTYSVAWIDCLATGARLGRSAILLGEHALVGELPPERGAHPFARPTRKRRRVPFDMPGFILGRTSVTAFNRLYYAAQRPGDAIVGVEPYFYPLDALLDWNRIYGRAGFVQYQCVLPLAASKAGLTAVLSAVAQAGQASFLAVLKRLGPQSFGLLSFPREGYTLALDFPATPTNFRLLDRLDAITVEHGGRLYLAKDARANAATVAAGYPGIEAFRTVRDRYGLPGRFSSTLSKRLGL